MRGPEYNKKEDRRKYSRLNPPIYYRVARSKDLRQRVSNISLGGVRIYSDERFDEGESVELEFFLPGGHSDRAIARVVWIKTLPPDSGANYDIGLEFEDLSEKAREELRKALQEKD